MMPRVTPEQLKAMVERELPGFKFRMQHRDDTHMVEMEVLRQIESSRIAISDLDVAHSRGDVLNYVTEKAVRDLRRYAIDAYGLNAEIDRRIAVAVKEALAIQREALMVELLKQIEQRRYVPVLDAEGYQVWEYDDTGEYGRVPLYKDTLPGSLLGVLDWAKAKMGGSK